MPQVLLGAAERPRRRPHEQREHLAVLHGDAGQVAVLGRVDVVLVKLDAVPLALAAGDVGRVGQGVLQRVVGAREPGERRVEVGQLEALVVLAGAAEGDDERALVLALGVDDAAVDALGALLDLGGDLGLPVQGVVEGVLGQLVGVAAVAAVAGRGGREADKLGVRGRRLCVGVLVLVLLLFCGWWWWREYWDCESCVCVRVV